MKKSEYYKKMALDENNSFGFLLLDVMMNLSVMTCSDLQKITNAFFIVNPKLKYEVFPEHETPVFKGFENLTTIENIISILKNP